MMREAYSADTALTPQAHQPALLRELAERHGLAAELAGPPVGQALLSPARQLAMLARLAEGVGRETGFLLGQQWLPGHYGLASLALAQAPNLGEALQLLIARQAELCPLLGPRLRCEGNVAVLYWTDSVGAGAHLGLLVDLHMVAVASMARWLGGERLPWRYHLHRSPPRDLAPYQVHLGPSLHFGAQFDAMVIDASWLARPWPRASQAGFAALQAQLASQPPRLSLLQQLYEQLRADIRRMPVLDDSAHALAISPATLKRHLARHGTHFQAVLDQVRRHEALFLIEFGGYDAAALADYFGFHDARNFSRSFSRWTGLGRWQRLPVLA